VKAARLFPLAGIGAVALYVAAFAIAGETPGTEDSLREIVSFYRDNDAEQAWAAAILAWGTGLFVLFTAGLWRFLRDAEPERHGGSALVLVGGTIFAVGATIFASIGFALGDAADEMAPPAIQALNTLNSDAFFTVALGGFAFMLGTGVSIIQTEAVPKWIGWLAVVIGIIALTPLGFFAFLAMGPFLLILAVVLWTRGTTRAPEAP
jgi:hypothetical protein